MKTINTAPHSETPLEESFKVFEETVSQQAQQQAESDALRNMPNSRAEFSLLTGFIRTQTQQFIDDCATQLHAFVDLEEAEKRAKTSSALVPPLEARLANITSSITTRKAEKKRLSLQCSSKLHRTLGYVGFAILGLAESSLSVQPFRHLKLGSVNAAIVALGVGVFTVLGCHLAGGWIKSARSNAWKAIIFFGVTAGYTLGFYELAKLRAEGLRLAALGFHDVTPSTFSPENVLLAFWIVSTSFSLLGLAGAIKVAPTQEQARTNKVYDQACTDLEELQSEHANLSKQIQDIKQDVTSAGPGIRKQHEEADRWLRRAAAVANTAQQAYMNRNSQTRGMVPEFFSEVLPLVFSFSTNH